MLSRLRSRLDPLYNASPLPPSESSSLPPMRLPPLEHPTHGPSLSTATEDRGSERANVREDTSAQGDHTEGSTSTRGSRKRTRRRKIDTQEASQSPGQPSGTQDGATASEGVENERQKGMKSTSREALIAGATGGSERKKRRRRERERSGRTSRRSVDEDTPDGGEEVTAEVTGERDLDDGARPPPYEGILYVCMCMLSDSSKL